MSTFGEGGKRNIKTIVLLQAQIRNIRTVTMAKSLMYSPYGKTMLCELDSTIDAINGIQCAHNPSDHHLASRVAKSHDSGPKLPTSVVPHLTRL